MVQIIVGNEKSTFLNLLAPSSKLSEPFTAHGKLFRQIDQKKMMIFTKISNLFCFIPIIIPILLPGQNTKKKY
jgi:hypothetical protein